MSKGLEALAEMRKYGAVMIPNCEIIEKELKEYEKMKAIRGTTTFDKAIEDTLINSCPNVAKKLKALEIIKKYNFRPSDFHYCATYSIYRCNMSFAEEDEIMSEEEFNLLKEVML